MALQWDLYLKGATVRDQRHYTDLGMAEMFVIVSGTQIKVQPAGTHEAGEAQRPSLTDKPVIFTSFSAECPQCVSLSHLQFRRTLSR